MGTYVKTQDIRIVVPYARLSAAYDAMMRLNDQDHLKEGTGSGKHRWFSWMPDDLRELKNLKAVWEALGFSCAYNEKGDLLIGKYDNKTGQEELFAKTLAPFVADGSFAFWLDENDEEYEWHFQDGEMRVKNCRFEE